MKQKYRASLACISVACSQAIAAGPDPADATAATPPTMYLSPFADYRPLGEDKNTAWRDANDTVGKIGGWRAYAREAAEATKTRESVTTRKAPDTEAGKAKPAPGAPENRPALPAQPHKHGG